MLKTDWSKLKFFKETENWGDPSKMEFGLLYLLDCYREFIGQEIVVAFGTQGEHVSKSQHSKGMAVDIVVDAEERGALYFLLAAFRFPFSGVGIYPTARCSKFKKPFGLHLDVGYHPSDVPRGTILRMWIGVRNESGGNDYFPLDEANLKRFGIIS